MAFLAPKTYINADGTLGIIDFPRETMQQVYGAIIQNDRNFYQAQFGVYGFLNVGRSLRAKIHRISGTPLLWKKREFNNCCVSTLGGTRTDVTEIDTTPLISPVSMCPDEVFDSCFEADIDPETNRPTSESAGVFGIATEVMGSYQIEALYGNMLVGGLFVRDALTRPDDVDPKTWEQLWSVLDSTRGILGYISQEGFDNNIIAACMPADMSCGFPGTTLEEIFEKYYCDCSRKLRNGVHRNVMVSGRRISPIFLVDDYTHNDVATYVSSFNSKKLAVVNNEVQLSGNFTARDFTWMGDVYTVYYYRNVPIIPESAINAFDSYLGIETRSISFTLASNFGFAARATELPTVRGDISVRVQQNPDLHCFDLKMLSALRMGAGIADPHDFLCTSTVYFVPAA